MSLAEQMDTVTENTAGTVDRHATTDTFDSTDPGSGARVVAELRVVERPLHETEKREGTRVLDLGRDRSRERRVLVHGGEECSPGRFPRKQEQVPAPAGLGHRSRQPYTSPGEPALPGGTAP